MRIVELLNDRPADDGPQSRCEEDERQRAFGELLVSGASARFLGLTEAAEGSKWSKEDENPLFLLLRATQQAVERAQGLGDVNKKPQQQKGQVVQQKKETKRRQEQEELVQVQEKAQQEQRKKQRKRPHKGQHPAEDYEDELKKKNQQKNQHQEKLLHQEQSHERERLDLDAEQEKPKKQQKKRKEEKPRTKEEARGVRRRAKQRVVFRRCYYKKINTLAALRDEHEAVRSEFDRLLARDRPPVSGEASTRDKFVALVLEKEALRKQHAELVDASTDLSKTRDTLQWLVDAELAAIKRGGSMESALYPTELLALEPITKLECDAIIKRVLPLSLDVQPQETNHADNVFGWDLSSINSKSDRVLLSSKCVESDKLPMELGRRTLELLKGGSGNPVLSLWCPWSSRKVDVSVIHSIDIDRVLVSVTDQGSEGSASTQQSLYLCACDPIEGEGCMLLLQPLQWKSENCSYEASSAGNGTSRCWISIKPSSKSPPESQVTIAYATPEVSIAPLHDDRSVQIDFARACREWEAVLVGNTLAFE